MLWLVGGVATGVVSALRRGTLWDRSAMTVALAGVSLPIYFTGLLSLAIFSYQLDWVDVELHAARRRPRRLVREPDPAVDHARLPLRRHVRPAHPRHHAGDHGRGLHPHRPRQGPAGAGRHRQARACAPPGPRSLTLLGLDLGALLGGAVLTETTFNLPGLGRLAVNAISDKDLPVILGVTLIAAFFIVVANLVVDLLYAVIDPRVRLG